MTRVRITIHLLLIVGIVFSGCVTDQSSSNKNPASTFADFSTLKYDTANCAKYQTAVGNGMTKIFEWEEACKAFGIEDVSVDSV